MKVVVAIDSFKGSLESVEAGEAIKEGILLADPEAEVVVKPVADGGEGTMDALTEALHGEKVVRMVTGPYHEKIVAEYGWIPEEKTAVIEMSAAAGITISERKEPLCATTFGVGEMIADALERGCRRVILGIGGSATNDCGLGMLSALGYRFLDENGEPCGVDGGDLKKVKSVDDSARHDGLGQCVFDIACDVKNPLCGKNGCTYIFGPQKGIKPEELAQVDRDVAHFADVTAQYTGKDEREVPGTGAAGGLGFAFLRYLEGNLVPGIELVLGSLGLEEEIRDADLVITGEGRLDHQTAFGKLPVGVAAIAKKAKPGIPVVAFAGSVTKDAGACNQHGIDAFFPILREITTLEQAMEKETACGNLRGTAEQVIRLFQCGRKPI